MTGATPYKYGHAHRKERARLLAAMPDGHPCARCHQPMRRGDRLELDHNDNDPTRYNGLTHRRCNQLAGASKGGRRRAQQRRTGHPTPTGTTWTSRNW